jgi:MFS family permease/tetratricopeptide (TPR) repeat protein
MRTLSRDRLLFAGLTFLVVFGSYVLTLAPTLTFWDAGEFIATSYSLGIPHPPGTPLFVLLGHVFGTLPLGIGFAAKTNLMSALASSVGGFFYFLVLAQIIGRIDRRQEWELPRPLIHVAALAAVCLSAWGLTHWVNSTETEVYTVALMTIALVTFLVFYWADHLTEGKDWNLILLVVYLMGLSIGNHLMALLVMPAVVVYVTWVAWPLYRGYVLSLLVGALGLYLVVMKGISVDGLIGGGQVVNPGAMLLGLLVLAAGAWWMQREGSLRFFLLAVAVFLAGASVILFLKIRAALDPAINEANPETWRELLAVLARKQYDVRPIFPRSVDFLRYQIPLYFDYLFGRVGPFQSNVSAQFGLPGLSIVVFGLAIAGSIYHFLSDRRTWTYFLLVWGMTSLGLIFYLNFPLGNTQAPDITGVAREVRERDYFFVVSFAFVGMWAGVGLFALLGEAWRRAGRPVLRGASLAAAAVALLLVPVVVFALNHHEADRSGNWIPRDFAYNLLQSVEPWGILFTNGDNDTFPLWYLQEVEGVRRDVSIVNLALLNTTWYLEQLDERVFTASDPPAEMAVDVPQELGIPLTEAGVESGPRPTDTILDYTGAADDPLQRIGIVIDEPTALEVAGLTIEFPANSVLRRQDVGVLQVVRKNLGRRPIYFSVTVPDDAKANLSPYLVREGIADHLLERPAEELARQGSQFMPMQPPEREWINVPRTELLLTSVYRYRGLDDDDVFKDGTARALTGNYGATFLQLAAAQARQRRTDDAIASLTRGHEILGREPTDESYVASLINVYAVSGMYGSLDSLIRAQADLTGGEIDGRLVKTAAYNAALAWHFDVAERLLDKYFEDRPQEVEPELWIEMGEIAIQRGDTNQGLTFLAKAIRSDPDNQRAFLRHINLAEDIGNDVMAKTFVYQWVKTHPGDTTTARLYEEYLATGALPAELTWENVTGASGAPVDTLSAGR